ncbi:hypothetical protein [Aquimarina algicola]|uniref:EF-hand domain-containing protein n=1 Tax=Aquimarina algicola TaxID=2589995 RepID=A0A504J5H8_9FLAO|nr:hypothetical protein [Aquimarina algicola]TPN86166.1 hypothetical protein FHK87_12915 [Aquimarina algicola]
MERKTSLIGYPIVIIITIIITFLVIKKCDNPTPPVDPPEEIISLNDAIELYSEYTTNRSCIIKAYEGGKDSIINTLCPSKRKPDLNFIPSRAFHLEEEFLEQYLAYIKQVTGDTVKVSGYRLYLGNYPDSTNLRDGKGIRKLDKRRNTIFIAPTMFHEQTNAHRGFTFIDKNNDGKVELQFIEELLESGESPVGEGKESQDSRINTASFFSFYSTSFNDEISTIANELGGSPPY